MAWGTKKTEHAGTGVIYRRNAELLQSLKSPQQKSRSATARGSEHPRF